MSAFFIPHQKKNAFAYFSKAFYSDISFAYVL